MVKSGKVVFDTSPIIFLTKLGYIEHALDLFESCFIPRAVKDELLEKKNTIASVFTGLEKSKTILIKQITHMHMFDGLSTRLGNGESEAVTLAVEIDADYIILDDHVARNEAKRIGLNVKGTLGIIDRLCNEKKVRIDDFKGFYNRLKDMNFRIRKDVFDRVFKGID
jgi:predicted nucleic acid-binding protein